MSAPPPSLPNNRRPRPAPRRTGLWVPALLSSLALAMVVGGIAIGQYFWSDLRSSMGHMDDSMANARERLRQMLEHFSEAQQLLLAQQQRIREAEEALRAREARLEAERADLETARKRLALGSASRAALAEQEQARELARRLDINLGALSDPDGVDSAAKTLAALSDWAASSTLVSGSTLAPTLLAALSDSKDALAQAQASGPRQLSERVERLGATAAALDLRSLAPGARVSAPGLASQAGAGNLGAQLEIALFALYRGDEALFRLALDTAGAWLAAFYDPARPEVQAVQSEIGALGRLPVSRDLQPLRAALVRARAVLGELLENARACVEPQCPTKTPRAETAD